MPGDPRRAEHIARNRLDGAQPGSAAPGTGHWARTPDGAPAGAGKGGAPAGAPAEERPASPEAASDPVANSSEERDES